jgi:hypothetical protein
MADYALFTAINLVFDPSARVIFRLSIKDVENRFSNFNNLIKLQFIKALSFINLRVVIDPIENFGVPYKEVLWTNESIFQAGSVLSFPSWFKCKILTHDPHLGSSRICWARHALEGY